MPLLRFSHTGRQGSPTKLNFITTVGLSVLLCHHSLSSPIAPPKSLLFYLLPGWNCLPMVSQVVPFPHIPPSAPFHPSYFTPSEMPPWHCLYHSAYLCPLTPSHLFPMGCEHYTSRTCYLFSIIQSIAWYEHSKDINNVFLINSCLNVIVS